jgi:hypothetical protein
MVLEKSSEKRIFPGNRKWAAAGNFFLSRTIHSRVESNLRAWRLPGR